MGFSMGKLSGKVALISGSGRGIGRALALKLASEGASVVVNDLDEAPALETVDEIRATGGNAVACIGSVSAKEFADHFVQTALSEFNGIDIIVNNAGYSWDSVVQKTSDEQFDAMYEVHVKAPFRILRAAAEPIRSFAKKESAERREVFRKVVNISSMAATNGNAGQIGYSAGKAAVIGITRTMAKEWGRYKVCVNCVAFGHIATRMAQPLSDTSKIEVEGREIRIGINPNLLKSIDEAVPLGRGGTPEEGANGIYLLCIPESNYITGQLLLVNGGLNF
jgi:3-oxoacyl-[acyl-carrier protein] reductase